MNVKSTKAVTINGWEYRIIFMIIHPLGWSCCKLAAANFNERQHGLHDEKYRKQKKGLDDSLSERRLQLVTHFHSVSIGSSDRWVRWAVVAVLPPALPSFLPFFFFKKILIQSSFPSDCHLTNRISIQWTLFVVSSRRIVQRFKLLFIAFTWLNYVNFSLCYRFLCSSSFRVLWPFPRRQEKIKKPAPFPLDDVVVVGKEKEVELEWSPPSSSSCRVEC